MPAYIDTKEWEDKVLGGDVDTKTNNRTDYGFEERVFFLLS